MMPPHPKEAFRNTPLVHVLVINWNGIEHLAECFDSLLAQTYPNARYFLVDNASDDGSVEYVRERYGADPRVEVLECPRNLGWSGGNNVGIQHALDTGADYVMLLNNDTATAPDALEKLIDLAESRPEVGALAPKMLLYDNPDILNSVGLTCSLIGSSGDIGIGRLDAPRWNVQQPVVGVCGGACLLRAEALRKAGLLPENFGIYLDDLDLCLRIWNAGYTIRSCPAARVRHKFGATMEQGRQSALKYYLNTRNRMYLLLRNVPLSRAGIVLPAFCLGEARAVGRALLNGESWRAVAHARAWAAALAYIPRALRERKARRQTGIARCRFWALVRRRPLFFDGRELPEHGWYAERDVGGERLRPIARHASLDIEASRLSVVLVNCYPALGAAQVEVRVNGEPLATLDTCARDEAIIDVPAGQLEFVARRIFYAEDTGKPIDIGGWLRVQKVQHEHEH